MSVIIASFQWPEALRMSLAGALAQTVEDLEVLVIEDGPDGASRAVVCESNDDRVRWMRLRNGSGSQAGPNACGLCWARAPIVAYLGQDDIWHPEHLASLLSVLNPTVDLAHAVTLLLGAEDDDRLEIAGCSAWEPATFVPPSSVAHWRRSPRIGAWIAPHHTGMPVDYAFLVAAHARGARFATSGVPTVFKFPAAWRLDSYRTRNVSPQLQLQQRLVSDPQVGEYLVRDAFAGVPSNLLAPPAAPPGVIADYNRRMKGLPARFAPPLTRWTPSKSLLFPGWHPAECDETGSFAWTGPQQRAFVRLDAPGDGGELGVRVVVRHVVSSEQLHRLVVDVDGTAVELERTEGRQGATVLTGWLGRGPREQMIEVGLTTTPAAPSARDPDSRDERLLGAAVSEIQLLNRTS